MIPIKQREGDLYARYDRTFVRYQGKVWYCRASGGEFWEEEEEEPTRDFSFRLSCPSNPGHNELIVDPYDGVDSKSVELGYVTTPEGGDYVSRSPIRRWKQTVPADTLENQLGSYAFSEYSNLMLQGEYPSLEEAIDIIEKLEYKEVAISRHLKIVRNKKNTGVKLSLYFKEMEVAEIPNFRKELVFIFKDRKVTWALSPYLRGIKWKVEQDD